MTAPKPYTRFISLQAGRFAAALLVALFHIEGAVTKIYGAYPLNDLFVAGHAGVEYFFVLSGFIIYLVHRRDLEISRNWLLFLTKRAVRILPTYWLAFACLLGGLITFPSLVQGRILSWQNIISDLLLLPRSGEMILGVAWTLRHELVFYLIFALGIFVPKTGLKLFVAWQVAVLINFLSPVSSDSPWIVLLLSVYNLGFGAGVLAARLLDHSMKRPAIMLALGSIAFILFMAVERLNEDASSNINGGLGTVLYTISAFLIVLSLAQLEAKLLFRRAWLIELLGGASYVFYLFHGLISSLFIRIIHLLAPNLFGWFVTIIAMVVTIFFVILIHVFVEIPLLRALAPRSPSVQRSTQELETWKP